MAVVWPGHTVPAVPKDETLTRFLCFWAQKLGSDLAPDGSKSTFDGADFDPNSGARLFVFSKNGCRVSGTKKKNR